MSNPVIKALSYGRAFAEVIKEKVEDELTDVLSAIGKFDAENNQWFKDFTQEVQVRAEREAATTPNTGKPVTISIDDESTDLQEMIDNLRAEIAGLKAELKQYRDQRNNY
ncbi:MAG: DUF6825 family protein [Limnothrix sp.]